MLQVKQRVLHSWSHSERYKASPQFSLMNSDFVNEAVKFPLALLENAKLTLAKKIFVTMRF